MPFVHISSSLLVLLLPSVVWSLRSDYVVTISPTAETDWGTWGNEEWCADGHYAYGFRVKVEAKQGAEDDDTGVNGIKLHCKSGNGASLSGAAQSKVGPWGLWGSSRNCDCNRFLSTVFMKSEGNQGSNGDDTAVNNFNFQCEDNDMVLGSGTPWGNWHGATCPTGTVICGLQTKVEDSQGNGDDTALNGAKFHCCTAPLHRGSAYTNCNNQIQKPNPSEWVPKFLLDQYVSCYPSAATDQYNGVCQTTLDQNAPIYYEGHNCSSQNIYRLTYWVFYGSTTSCYTGDGGNWRHVTINFKQCDRKYCVDSIMYAQHDGFYTRQYIREDEGKTLNVIPGRVAKGNFHDSCCPSNGNCEDLCSSMFDCNYWNDIRKPFNDWKSTNPRPLQEVIDAGGVIGNFIRDYEGRNRCDRNTCHRGCYFGNWDLYS